MSVIDVQVIEKAPVVVEVIGKTPVSIDTITGGPPGPQGEQGPQGVQGDVGPRGPAGTGVPFEYVQAIPATSWTVVHGLGHTPASASVYDTNGNRVETGVVVIDLNTIEITMAAPMAGKVEVL